MQIHFTSEDPEPGNIVEGGIDDFRVEGELLTTLEDESSLLTFDLFPNPVQDQLQIAYEQQEAISLTFLLTNIQGQKLAAFFQPRQTNGHFSIPFPYPSGIYFLQIRKDNRLIGVEKIVK